VNFDKNNHKKDVRMLKRLVAGQMSLPMTFWGWGFCGIFCWVSLGLLECIPVTRQWFRFPISLKPFCSVLYFPALLSFCVEKSQSWVGSLFYYSDSGDYERSDGDWPFLVIF
jgi:hypothetical protein